VARRLQSPSRLRHILLSRLEPGCGKAGINPFVHYLLHGREEGRASQAADERDRGLALDYFIIAPEFDVSYYLSEYPDVKNSNLDPIKHFVTSGWTEGRRPHYLLLFYE
jgi:hypothetical protein